MRKLPPSQKKHPDYQSVQTIFYKCDHVWESEILDLNPTPIMEEAESTRKRIVFQRYHCIKSLSKQVATHACYEIHASQEQVDLWKSP